MGYELEEYLGIPNDNNTCLEVVSNKDHECNLIYQHISNGSKKVPIWELISESLTIDRPKELFEVIKNQYCHENKPVTVAGVSAYLSILDESTVHDFYVELKNHLDQQDLNAKIVILSEYFDYTSFSNPKYQDSLQIVVISGEEKISGTPAISICPEQLCLDPSAFHSYPQLLEALNEPHEDFQYTLALETRKISRVGLNKSINATDNPEMIFEQMTGCKIECGEIDIEALFRECKTKSITLSQYMDEKIGLTTDPRELFVTLVSHLNDPFWNVYCYYIMKKINPNCFLSKVLSQKPTHKSFLHRYVVDTPLELIHDTNAEIYAKERSSSLRDISPGKYVALVAEFVSRVKNEPNSTIWLNCNTVEEKCELISRVSITDTKQSISSTIAQLFPELDYYYSEYEYATPELTNYFRQYRYHKVTNTLTSDFIKLAESLAIPDIVPERDQELSHFKNETNTALLLVDGLGAEYIPLIVSELEKMSYKIELCEAVKVRLPTSTEFNKINWNNNLLPEIKGIDNTAHNGAIKNENTSVERNFYESLRVIKDELLNRVSKSLSDYSKIIITADHGMSRLAVLANELKLVQTLEWEGEPDDWRFAKAPNSLAPPQEFIKKRDVENNTIYWVVKGYNRLPKSGGKKYELHGGASIEERLVPFIVVSSEWNDSNNSKQSVKSEVKKPEQIKEKALFADLD